MDGVLVDTEPLHIEAFRRFMDTLVLEYDPAYIRSFVGYSIDQNVRKINRDFLAGREIDVDEGVRQRDNIYIALLKESLRAPLPGVVQLARFCESNYIATALASSSWQEQVHLILDILEQNGFALRARFQSIVNGDQVKERKPAPDIYLKTIQNLALPPANCWAIEDSAAGVQSAKAAGIHVIGLTSPFNTRRHLQPADRIVTSLSEARNFLQTLL